MNIIAVDDEEPLLSDLREIIEELFPEGAINCFVTTREALDFASKTSVDFAFLDIEIDSINGLELAKKLKDISGKTKIIFATGYSDYAYDAFGVFASGYLLKPITKEAVLETLMHLDSYKNTLECNIYVQTFGEFNIFVNQKKISFPRSKAKELLAYLVFKRGTSCTSGELMSILYEDKDLTHSIKHQLQTTISVMMKTLKEAGAKDIIIKNFNSLSIDVSKIDCDYYHFLRWEPDAINAYSGEFMKNYNWAEFVITYLDKKAL